MMMSDVDKELVRGWTETPLPTMSLVIATLRDYGEDDLADKLTRLKEQWVREVVEATRG